MKMQAMAEKVADALVKAIAEHGTPNTFGFGELVGRKRAPLAGRAVRECWRPFIAIVYRRDPDVRAVNLENGRLAVE